MPPSLEEEDELKVAYSYLLLRLVSNFKEWVVPSNDGDGHHSNNFFFEGSIKQLT